MGLAVSPWKRNSVSPRDSAPPNFSPLTKLRLGSQVRHRARSLEMAVYATVRLPPLTSSSLEELLELALDNKSPFDK